LASITNAMHIMGDPEPLLTIADDNAVEQYSSDWQRSSSIQMVPLLQNDPSSYGTFGQRPGRSATSVLKIALDYFPFPDESSAWQDVLDFKLEMHDKAWDFRRFINTLVTKAQCEAEIRDDIEWSLNAYTKAMKNYHLGSCQSFIDVFVITPMEILENLAKFNWSKIARGLLQAEKRKIALREAESKAPGRDCAYIFDARNRFRRTSR
jgi:hypothetical protein